MKDLVSPVFVYLQEGPSSLQEEKGSKIIEPQIGDVSQRCFSCCETFLSWFDDCG